MPAGSSELYETQQAISRLAVFVSSSSSRLTCPLRNNAIHSLSGTCRSHTNVTPDFRLTSYFAGAPQWHSGHATGTLGCASNSTTCCRRCSRFEWSAASTTTHLDVAASKTSSARSATTIPIKSFAPANWMMACSGLVAPGTIALAESKFTKTAIACPPERHPISH